MAATISALAVGAVGFVPCASVAAAETALQGSLMTSPAYPSTYLAGYRATPSGGLASANVTFTVPTISCTATDYGREAAEMAEGVYTDSLDGPGKQLVGSQIFALVQFSCSSSRPHRLYAQPWMGTPAGSHREAEQVDPGDTIVASISQSSSATSAEIDDLTKGENWLVDGPDAGDTTIDIGSLTNAYSHYPIPTFKQFAFSDATVNGVDLSSVGATRHVEFNRGEPLIAASRLTTTGTGSTFSLKFKRAT